MQPWMIPIVVMICVTLIVAITTTGGIIKAKIKQKSGGNLSENREFLEALREFKETMERRVANLEAIAAGDELSAREPVKRAGQKTGNNSIIDLEVDESQIDKGSEKADNSKLKNMLNQQA